ncbi:hypothetical protein CC78DRAFT_339672 [Lojkania enalia]|uniref:Uncharacterized protein n=1 Tax=Lojkania enalia TaxID=147567 RepID=A0A9P4N4C1_9PLEO|nr:hypothetical protein CC78DRAFT_339672 [Didymosphaeria enalia]
MCIMRYGRGVKQTRRRAPCPVVVDAHISSLHSSYSKAESWTSGAVEGNMWEGEGGDGGRLPYYLPGQHGVGACYVLACRLVAPKVARELLRISGKQKALCR